MCCRNCGTENAADGWFCQDCGEDLCHRRGIQDTAPGSASRVNVQDANILKIQILHGHKLKVPFVGPILAQAAALTTGDPERLIMLADNRLPMLTTATVRIQSAARANGCFCRRPYDQPAMASGGTWPILVYRTAT